MHLRHLSIILCLFCGLSYSQEDPIVFDSLQKKKIQVIDSISVSSAFGDISKTIITTKARDTMVFDLKDLEEASKLDSEWLKLLYDNELFEEVYGSVINQSYEPVDYEELPTDLLKQRLAELNARTPFNVEYNPSLESVIKNYLKYRKESLTKLMSLADYYFPMFEEELDRHGLPLELKYLAIVESALDPKARSRVGAKGLWQFMYRTGKMFGLDVSSYVDERSDPILATEAASKYLHSLYQSLGDWDLTLAAYNSGPGNVSKAIRRSGGNTNYWNIRHHLPRETAGYVPAFLATMYIFEYAEEHGLKSSGPRIPYVATDTIRVKQMIHLRHVAEVINMDLEEVQFLNPSYILDIIPLVKDENYVLRLPVSAIGKFVANETAIYAYAQSEFDKKEKALPKYFEQSDKIRYRVRSGDYLGKIAEQYGVGVSQIKRWNGMRNNRLQIGQRLTIYPRKNGADLPSSSGKPDTTEIAVNKVYTVKSGDSLWSISQKFPGLSVANIKKWNDISGTKLKPGMRLTVSK